MLNKFLFLYLEGLVLVLVIHNVTCLGKSDVKDRQGENSVYHFDGCRVGWFRFKDYKCVLSYDLVSTYAEAHEYCKTAFGGTLLNITSEEERVFWSFHLLRYKNVSANVWLATHFANEELIFNSKTSNCKALRSKYAKDSLPIGAITQQNCQDKGTTVCEISANKKLKSEEPVKDFNVNTDFIANTRMKFLNGTRSDFFTGVYYVISSKYNDTNLNNRVLGSGKCQLINAKGNNCLHENVDPDIDAKYANYYTFTNEPNNYFQIRKFNSDKILAYENQKFLVNFKTFEDGITKLGREATKDSLRDNGADDLWKFEPYGNTGYYVITSRTNDYTLGAVEYLDGKNTSLAFGLYDKIDLSQKLHDKLLFSIDPLNYTLDVELIAIDFDKTLEQIVATNTKEISILDSDIINNNSPATLQHQVSSTKEMTETFTASYGLSQEFMEAFKTRNTQGASSSNSDTQSQSFTDRTAQAISSSLTQTVSKTHSEYDFTHNAKSTDAKVEAGVTIGVFHIGGSLSHHSEHSHDHSTNDSLTTGHSNTNGKTDSKGHDNTTGHDNTKTDGKSDSHSNENTNQNKNTTSKRIDLSGTNTKTYSVQKTVNLPPYTAVKISSYANWINDINIKFKLKLKFSARSFRRSVHGDTRNEWRTMDSEFVKYLMDKHHYKGDVLKTTYDSIYGQIEGFLTASVGLESVFIAKEVEVNKPE